MKTIGLKFTHDAAVAVFEDDQLVISVEAEKIGNQPRHSKFNSWHEPFDALQSNNVDFSGARLVIDGWKKRAPLIHFAPEFRGASYFDWDNPEGDIINQTMGEFGGQQTVSYTHIFGHIACAVSMSPFPLGEDVYVLVWDGGTPPRLFVCPDGKPVNCKPVAVAHWLEGTIYGIMGYYWGPFRDEKVVESIPFPEERKLGGYSTPGKLMAFIGKGVRSSHAEALVERAYLDAYATYPRNKGQGYHNHGSIEHYFCRTIDRLNDGRFDDPTILLAIHHWLERQLVSFVNAHVPSTANLAFVGGSALNIKWNSAIRNSRSGEFFVPPVPNDCGSAIGAACADLSVVNGIHRVKWSVFSGPELIVNGGWVRSDKNLADLLRSGEVVMRLEGRAEIGPRALGHRSLLADPRNPDAKGKLNKIKRREDWRPVAPICTLEAARKAFGVSGPDPYMLFDHPIADKSLVAISHFDNTARVQTVLAEDAAMGKILEETGGVLCNTSANFLGSGFFPDTASAASWAGENGVRYALINGTLMEREA